MALAKIGKVAKMMGVTPKTLLAWERSGELVPDRRSKGGVRYYDLDKVTGLSNGLSNEGLPTVGYARASTRGSGPDPENELSRQEELLEAFCAAQGWRYEIISDPIAGLEGLKRLLELILYKRIHRLVVTHQDQLLQFGSKLMLTLCGLQNIEVVVTHQGEPPPAFNEEELVQDIELRRLCERRINASEVSLDGEIKSNGASLRTSLPGSQSVARHQGFDNLQKPSGVDIRQLNEDALANLAAWVPELRLYRCRHTRQGFGAESPGTIQDSLSICQSKACRVHAGTDEACHFIEEDFIDDDEPRSRSFAMLAADALSQANSSQ
jgi:predicted site-specific integrase-resolvase